MKIIKNILITFFVTAGISTVLLFIVEKNKDLINAKKESNRETISVVVENDPIEKLYEWFLYSGDGTELVRAKQKISYLQTAITSDFKIDEMQIKKISNTEFEYFIPKGQETQFKNILSFVAKKLRKITSDLHVVQDITFIYEMFNLIRNENDRLTVMIFVKDKINNDSSVLDLINSNLYILKTISFFIKDEKSRKAVSSKLAFLSELKKEYERFFRELGRIGKIDYLYIPTELQSLSMMKADVHFKEFPQRVTREAAPSFGNSEFIKKLIIINILSLLISLIIAFIYTETNFEGLRPFNSEKVA